MRAYNRNAGCVAQPTDVVADPVAIDVAEQRLGTLAAIAQREQGRAQHLGDLEVAVTLARLGALDPEHASVVVNVTDLTPSDLAGAQAHQESHGRGDSLTRALVQRDRDEPTSLVDAELLLTA